MIGGAAAAVGGVRALTALARFDDAIDPRSYGAKGDGSTDDTEAVRQALSSAFDRNMAVDGGDAQFGVRGTLRFADRTMPRIRSLRLKQLTPADDTKTLLFSRCERITIERLQIDLGTAKSRGYFNESGGLWIDGGADHNVSNVEAFGAGRNSLIAIWNTRRSTYSNLYAHDGIFGGQQTTDDVLQGIFLCRNSECNVRSPKVSNLSGNASVRFPTRFTRGIVLCGNTNVSIADANVSNVDQGIDLTGSDGNRRCEILRAYVYKCNSVGVKLANSAVDCRVVDSIVEQSGLMGFFASGPSEAGLRFKTQNCDFIRCTSYDPGYNGFSDSAPHAGFRVERNRFDQEYPMGIRFIDCRAVDRQTRRTMDFGFYEDVRPGAQTRRPNQLIGCTSSGHLKAMERGSWDRAEPESNQQTLSFARASPR